MRSQRDSLCDACLLAFTRARMQASTQAHAHARTNTVESESPTRYALYALTQRAFCVYTHRLLHRTPARQCACIYDKCVRDKQMRTCVNVEDLVAFANDAGTMYQTQFSIVLYIRYIGTVRLHLLASDIVCLNRSLVFVETHSRRLEMISEMPRSPVECRFDLLSIKPWSN